jgi:hypothetical protein
MPAQDQFASLSFARLAGGQVNPGTPSWSAYDSGQYDTINLQNLNVSVSIPFMSKSGAFPFNATLGTLQSFVWLTSKNYIDPAIVSLPSTAYVNGMIGSVATFVNYTSSFGVTCPSAYGSGPATEITGWFVELADGTIHPLPTSDVTYYGAGCSSSFTDTTTDNSAFTVTVTGETPVSLYSSGGLKLATNGSSISDAQSSPNTISFNGSAWTDTLGLTALTSTGLAYTWTDTNGGSQTLSMTRALDTMKTVYGCSGITDFTSAGSYLPTSISFPDTTSIGFSWEPTPGYSSDTTGRLAEITLRSGSTVSYNWNPNSAANDGLNCTYLVPNKMTRTTSDGTVSYTLAFSLISGSNYKVTDTKIDIGGNKTVYTFTGLTSTGNVAAPAIQALTEVQYYQNTNTVTAPMYSSTPTKVVIYCYNSSAPTVANCPTATVSEPVTEVDAFTQLSGMSNYARQQTQYDGGPSGTLPHYGNMTYSAQYDFGGTSPITATTNVYAVNGSGNCSGISATIKNKICSSTTTVNGNTVAASKYAYSSTGNLLTAYVSPNGGSSYLSNPTANSYNSNGTPSVLYDFAGNSTTFAYNASYYTNCSNCTQYPFPTKRVSGGLTTYAFYNGYGGVKTEDEDANGNNTFYCYNNTTTTSCGGGTADPWNRVMAVIDPLNNEVFKTYSVTSLTSSFTFNGNSSIQGGTTTFDGYGRVINVQRPQSPTGSNYDTTSIYRTFPSGIHVNEQIQSTNPCSVASATLCGTSYGPTNTYDMLGRLISSVQTGSNATSTITYSENDVLTAITPAPSGENKKQVQNQYDGLGRLTSSCAISSNVSGNVSCGQNVATSPSNGILTTTTYSSAAGSQTVTVSRGPSNQQQRSITTDGLGRITQKKTPEGGTWTYIYDSNTSSCPSGWQGVTGQIASVSDPNGNLFCYSYDSLNRVTGVNADGTTCRWFYYDNGEGNGATSGGYTGTIPSGITLSNQYGRMVEAVTDACVAAASHTASTLITDEWFAYDKDGHQATLWQLTPHSTQYYESIATFFGNGVPATVDLANPSEYTMTYGIDGEGRFNKLTDTTASQDIVTGTTYFPAANPEVVSLTSTDNNAYTYDLNTNQMTKFVFTVGSNNLTGNLYWNANNTLGYLTVTDGFNSGGSETCYSNASGSVGAGYDDLGRLVEFDCGSGNWGQQFAYDQFDNLTKTVLSGRTGTTWNPTYNTSNQCPSPCTYDSDGNMTADGNDVYGWNAFSKLAWTATSGTPTCGTSGRCATYDAFGRMVETSNNSGWYTYWYTQAGGVVMMSGTTISYAHWPTTHGIAELLDTTNFGYMPKDWIGNTRIVSNIGNHTVSADQSYTPYGEIYNIFGANNGQYQVFAGTIAELAGSTTTPIMWDTPNRELSYSGRWLSPDPAGVGWNQYAYPTNPNSFSDPSGLIGGPGNGGTLPCMISRGNAAHAAVSAPSGCAGGPSPYTGGQGSDPFGSTGQGYTNCDAGGCGIPPGSGTVGADGGSSGSGGDCSQGCVTSVAINTYTDASGTTLVGTVGPGPDFDLNFDLIGSIMSQWNPYTGCCAAPPGYTSYKFSTTVQSGFLQVDSDGNVSYVVLPATAVSASLIIDGPTPDQTVLFETTGGLGDYAYTGSDFVMDTAGNVYFQGVIVGVGLSWPPWPGNLSTPIDNFFPYSSGDNWQVGVPAPILP